MNTNSDPTAVNPLITEYLEPYESEVRELALQAIRLAGTQGLPALVEQMTAHVRKRARESKGNE